MSPRERRGAAIVLALLLPSLAAMWMGLRTGGDDFDRPGPLRTFAHAGADHAAFLFGGALHLFDAQGRRLARQPLLDLALTEEPNDMDWTRGADGSTQAWFFEDSAPRIVRCDLAEAPLRLHHCSQVLAGPQLKVNARSRAVHLAVDAARGRVFIADAKGHAVRALSLQGQRLGDSPAGELFFPNRLRLMGDALVVADNDHRRLVWLDVAGERPSFQRRHALPLAGHPAGGGLKAADFALGRDAEGDGHRGPLWALGVQQGQMHGRVLAFGPGLAPLTSPAASPWSDPLVVDRLGDDLLVADFDGVALFRLAADGRYLGEFGDAAFQAEIGRARAVLAGADGWLWAGRAGLALALAVGLWLGWRWRPPRPAGADAAAFGDWPAVPPEPAVLPLDLRPAPWHVRRVALVAVTPLLLLVLVVFGVGWALPHELPPGWWEALPARQVLLLVVAPPLAALVMLASGLVIARRQLRLHGDRVEVRVGERLLATARLDEVVASPRSLVIGQVMLPYRAPGPGAAPGRWIFDATLLTRHLLGRLGPAQRLTDAQLSWRQIQQLRPWQKALGVLVLAALIAGLLWQELR